MAESFKARPVYFGYLAGKVSPLKIALRYLVMTSHTVAYILRHRPRLVFVMNQPVFLPLTVFLLSRLTGVKYVIDSHSGLFLKPQWRWSLPVMKFAYRHSLFSIVTNQKHRDLVVSWGTRAEILGALSLDPEPVVPFNRPDGPCLVVIGSFALDEPTREILEACRLTLQVHYFITGPVKNAPPDLIRSAPDNVTFTDFQPRPNYVGLVQAVDGAMILVKNDDTMQRGAYEAMSWDIPIITSDWPLLRESFHRGAIFVENTPEKIAQAVQELLADLEFYKREIARLSQEKRRDWDENISRINQFIERMP